jgi:uncharacterized coiled-coil protein SlyX
MANQILKGLAIAAGTGLAMGFTSGRVRVRAVPGLPLPLPASPANASRLTGVTADDRDDEFLNIEPLLDRLEELETRVESFEQRPRASETLTSPSANTSHYATALADLDRRAEENAHELTLLRKSFTEAEQRLNESVASVGRRIEQTRAELPAIAERHIASRIDDVERRFAAEIEQMYQRSLETFERAIDEKIASRIGSIEKAIAEQAESIEGLSVRAAETDHNLQRLVAAIERLCERAQSMPSPARQPYPVTPIQGSATYEAKLPFESQLDDALEREPVVPVLRTGESAREVHAIPPSFAVSEARASKKSRFLFRNLIVVGLTLLGSRFLR